MIVSALRGTTRRALTGIVGAVIIVGCGTAEKYQKPPEGARVVSGEAEMRLSTASAAWARELSSAMQAGKIVVDMGDTTRGLAITDSVLKIAGAVLDTLPSGTELQKFLILLVADGYGRLVSWEQACGNEAAAAALTGQFADLATKLKARRDSALLRDAESTATSR